MLKIRRFPILTLSISIVLFYGWNFIFWENEGMKFLGINALKIIGGTLSFIWLFKAYHSITTKQRSFWLLLSMGMLFYLSFNLIRFYFQISQRIMYSADSFLTLAYIFFLIALVYKTREISAADSQSSYVFDIIIFMITATSVSIHYAIRPIMAQSDLPLWITVLKMAFPIMGLSILFVTTILYYLIRYSREKNLMLFIVVGFFLQVAADLGNPYLSIMGNDHARNMIDLFWLIALLLIGFAGYYAKENKPEPKWVIENPFEREETFFPYASIVILIILVTSSYHWHLNALNLGFIITFLMIIVRQLIIMNKSNKLMGEYRHLAYHDPLTGLNNRASFGENLENIMENYNNSRIALLLIDLDRFKVVNDTLGHYVGDTLLIKTAERLRHSLGTDAKIFRLGGDEFVIILSDANKEKCSIVAEMILTKFQKPFLVGEYEIIVTPSIGISISENGDNGADLFKHADAAMYLAKESGKNSFKFYNTELNEIMVRKMTIENELRKAIERNQFSLCYQSKVELLTKKIIGMEALLRWEHPELGWISPAEFISVAEETGQIIPIGEWVLKMACKQNKMWQEKGFPPLCVSVNVSVLQFQHGNFLTTVRNVLHETGLSPQYLELEITESIMQNIGESTEILHGLRKMGIQTSIDDFGKGYSSLHVLQKLPIDTIKIDKSFIDDIGNMNQISMVKTIIDLGLNLNLKIVAEGIEHEHQMKMLTENKCNIGQGYLFSKPLHPKDFENIILVGDVLPRTLPQVMEASVV